MSPNAVRHDEGGDPLVPLGRRGVHRRFAPALEGEYRAFQDVALKPRLRWAMGAAVAVLCVYAVLDLVMIPREILGEVLAMRIGLMVMPPLLALVASLRLRSGRALHLMAGWACLTAGLGAVVLIVRTRVLGMPVDYEGVLLLLMYIYGCGAMRLRTAVACGTTICVVYPLAEAWAGLPPDALKSRTLFIVTTNVIGIVTAWILDQEARGNFLVTRQLRGMAHLDFLTGLPNRRAFAERMEAAWKRACEAQCPLGIALVDVDWFKAYNDRYGHPAGDRVLRSVAQVLARHAGGPEDLVARLGGEEFVCVWYGAADEAARAATDAIHADVAALEVPHAGSVEGRLTLSIGLHVLVPQPGQSRADALYQADQALYEAKAAGRNRTAVGRCDGYVDPEPVDGGGALAHTH
jgi:diguanylate cyclase (GGDEF)-like protein